MILRPWGFGLAAIFLLAASVSFAAPKPVQGGSIAERYEHARHELEDSRAVEAQTQAEHDRLAREAEELRASLIANAARVQTLEASLTEAETVLNRLAVQMRALQSGFARDRDKIAHLLAVLQRIDSDEPPALALRPDDSLSAVRGAMLLGAMLPPVYEQAVALARRLHNLQMTQAALVKKRSEARATAAALGKARLALTVLLDKRSSEAQTAEARLADLHAVTEEVAREAGDLKSLMDRIAVLRTESGGLQGMTVVTAENTGPAIIRKGGLRRPVIGQMVRGGPDAPGPVTAKGAEISGLWFLTAGGAQAIAPADSEVVFAGSYQKFGQVLILEIAGGYDLLLAGLGRISVRIGDSVLAGEPVGTLPQGTQARLYMELRRGGETVNPAPWLAAEQKKAKG
jgi:septal ring factor EnvC (AmiA/AmiB activator)